MNKFIVISLLIVNLSVDCFGLRCHFCKGSKDDSPFTECPEGMETEVRECHVFDSICTIHTLLTGERAGLGCVSYDYQYHYRVDPLRCQDISVTGKDDSEKPALDCFCITDSCNIYTEDDIKNCFGCEPEDYEGELNLCASGDKGEARPCPVGMKYCYNTVTSNLGGNKKYYRGCTEELPPEKDQFTLENSLSCRVLLGADGTRREECFCASEICNKDLVELPHLEPANKNDYSDIWCLVCIQGGGNHLCGPKEEGEPRPCPLGTKYCYNIFTSKLGMNKKYYRGCAEELPTENDKFTLENSLSCRALLESDGTRREECFCTSEACNKNVVELPHLEPENKNDYSDIWCLVCTEGPTWRGENSCGGREAGETQLCPSGTKYCKKIWDERGSRRGYYKGCVKELPEAGNNKFTEKDSAFCRVVVLESGNNIRQECYCTSNNCNSKSFDDLPNFRCYVCSGADNLCTESETYDQKVKLCPEGTTHCNITWTSYFGSDYDNNRKHYKGCAKELPPAGNNKFTEVSYPASASCRRVELVDEGLTRQECYCTSNACNNRFEDLPEPDDENALKCNVCSRGKYNLCRANEEGAKKQCPTGTKYCYSTWVEHPDSGLDRVYYKGCAQELPAEGKDKFEVEDFDSGSRYCRVRIPEKGKVTQECYCQSELCNQYYFEDLPIPEPPEEIYEIRCNPSKGGDNTFASLITVPVILLHIILV